MYNPYKTNYEEIKCDCGRIAVVLITPNGEKLPTYGVYSEEAKDMVYVPNGYRLEELTCQCGKKLHEGEQTRW